MEYGVFVTLLLVYAGFVTVDLFGDGKEGWRTSIRESPMKNYTPRGKSAFGIFLITYILAVLVEYVGMFFLWNLAPFLFTFGLVCKNLWF